MPASIAHRDNAHMTRGTRATAPADCSVLTRPRRPAIEEMINTEGPYLLDVMVPHIEHVLPMIPGGGSFADVITKGDGENPNLK